VVDASVTHVPGQDKRMTTGTACKESRRRPRLLAALGRRHRRGRRATPADDQTNGCSASRLAATWHRVGANIAG